MMIRLVVSIGTDTSLRLQVSLVFSLILFTKEEGLKENEKTKASILYTKHDK